MMNIPRRKELSLIALEGLTVGDCFGEAFFASQDPENDVHNRALPSHRWQYTDDTEMALSTVTVLHELGRISQDDLARSFARHYDPSRGYGPAMHRTLEGIRDGIPWMQLAQAAFDGQGSHGNGAAMRVPPLGAYFFDEPQLLIQQAILSAEITHSHPEGIAGAVAVAVAAARATQSRVDQIPCGPYEFIDYVAFHTPASEVRSKILRGRSFLDPAKICVFR
jgi:ADP-ribosylglycohydrolase